jgi:hypothetical protein
MEPEGSLPHSQVPATCPYPKPAQSPQSPHPTSWKYVLILSSHLRLRLPKELPLYARNNPEERGYFATEAWNYAWHISSWSEIDQTKVTTNYIYIYIYIYNTDVRV